VSSTEQINHINHTKSPDESEQTKGKEGAWDSERVSQLEKQGKKEKENGDCVKLQL
jgi:hypothetical protein